MTRLIVLPGMDGTGLLLNPFIRALGPGFDVKIVRYPNNRLWGYSELENVARAALPETGPFFILGESFSGPLAVKLASKCSSQVKGLILCGSFVRNPRPGLAWLRPFMGLFPTSDKTMSMLSPLLLGRQASHEMRLAFSEALRSVTRATLLRRLNEVLAVNVSDRFIGLDIPILYLRASGDRIVPRSASELAQQLNQHVRVADIDGPHFLLQAAPIEAAQIVSRFINGIQVT